jgi:hypothetical protein
MTEENISNLLMMMSEAGSNVDKFKKSYEKAITERVATECEVVAFFIFTTYELDMCKYSEAPGKM